MRLDEEAPDLVPVVLLDRADGVVDPVDLGDHVPHPADQSLVVEPVENIVQQQERAHLMPGGEYLKLRQLEGNNEGLLLALRGVILDRAVVH